MASAARDLRYQSGYSVDGSLARDLDWAVRERELRHAGEAPRHQERNIVKEEPDAAQDTTSTDEEAVALNINVRNITIKERGYFVFDNRQEQLRASLFLNSLELQGRFTNDIEKIRIRRGNFSRVNLAVAQQGVNKYLTQLVADNGSIPDSLAAKNLSILSQANRASLRFSIDTLNLESINRGEYGIEARTRTNVRLARNAIAENLPLDINGNISLKGRNSKSIAVEDLKISLAGIPFNINGAVKYGNGSLQTDNLVAKIEEFPLEEFIKYIPKAIVPQKEKVNTNARLSVEANIYGTYSAVTGEFPYADIAVKIPNSHIGFQGRKEKIKDLHLNATYHFRGDNADSKIFIDSYNQYLTWLNKTSCLRNRHKSVRVSNEI